MHPLLILLLFTTICLMVYFCVTKNVKQQCAKRNYENFGNMKPIAEGLNPQFLPTDKICTTPLYETCITNDSCAQYGLGESCSGPIGNMKCMCNSTSRDGQKLSASNALIKSGSVCSENSQCETGFCESEPGLFSKMCKCPPDSTEENGKCIQERKVVVQNSIDNFGLGYNIPPVPATKKQACETTGKLCKSNEDCSLGEGCNSNGMCICLLNYTNDVQANLITVGGNCENDKQCEADSKCVKGECSCPAGTFYNFTNNRCECGDPELIYNEKVGCVPPSQLPRDLCNTPKDFICDSNKKCGLGEYCDPVTRRCICNADIYNNVIKEGAKCENNNQCDSGVCDNMDGKLDYKVCRYIPVQVHDFAVAKYAF